MLPLRDIPEEGLFGPESMIWRIAGENVTVLGGAAATILQVAHPKVGQGVEDHSDFRNDALGRLDRTLKAIYAIAYGDRQEIEAMAKMVAKRHGKVRGEMAKGGGSYSAFDPELQLWVIATLVMTASRLYADFVRPLSVEEKQQYLDDMRLWGEFFGLDRGFGPQRWDEFEAYYHETINGDLLGSTPVNREVVHGILNPSKPWWLKAISPGIAFLGVELVPQPLHARLGLKSTAWTRFAWKTTRIIGRRVLPLLPDSLRFAPQCRTAWRKAGWSSVGGGVG